MAQLGLQTAPPDRSDDVLRIGRTLKASAVSDSQKLDPYNCSEAFFGLADFYLKRHRVYKRYTDNYYYQYSERCSEIHDHLLKRRESSGWNFIFIVIN